jgi:hypothetical protein
MESLRFVLLFAVALSACSRAVRLQQHIKTLQMLAAP